MRSPHLRYVPVSSNRSVIILLFTLVLLLGACNDAATPSTATSGESQNDLSVSALSDSSMLVQDGLSATSLTLPFNGSVNSFVPGFEVRQYGSSDAGRFEVFASAANALEAQSGGPGNAILGRNTGNGSAGVFITPSLANLRPTLVTFNYGNASAAEFDQLSVITQKPAVKISNAAPGNALLVDHRSSLCSSSQTSCNLAVFQTNGLNKIRFARGGKGYFALGTVSGGADLAEAFEVEGEVSDVEPGDVLVISLTSDRKVERSREPYSTLLAGVYATRPGVLLTERDIDDPMTDMVPLGVIGVIPTKVSAVNGPIRRGDLLVSSGEPGYAMRGTDHRRMTGAILGRALQEFNGPGKGMIQVLVSVR